MEDLHIALLIAGIVVVIGILAYVLYLRRRAAEEPEALEDSELGMPDPQEDWEIIPIERAPPEADAESGAGTGGDDLDDLDDHHTAGRGMPEAESSVDVNILSGLRATYETSVDDTIDDTVNDAAQARMTAGLPEDDVAAAPVAHAGAEWPIAIDMTRPLIYLTVVVKQGWISGRVVLESLDAEDFRPGLMQLYYWRNDADPSVVFGVANMVEPGVLDPEELPGMESPGLVTFMSVPEDAATAFRILDAMVAVSRRLARRLDATLCDETRSTLTAQAENHLREKIADALRQDRIRD